MLVCVLVLVCVSVRASILMSPPSLDTNPTESARVRWPCGLPIGVDVSPAPIDIPIDTHVVGDQVSLFACSLTKHQHQH